MEPDKVLNEVRYLREQIEVERNEKRRIIEQLTAVPIEDNKLSEQKPVSHFKPFRVIRAELEKKYAKPKVATEKVQSTEELEKELGVK